ncbi:MAG: molybdopterin converting factor, large subunit, partial [halophilic archaeon J07HB67]
MQTLTVVGADPDLRAVASRLDGRTATVSRGAVDTPTGTDTAVTLSPDGSRATRAVDDLPSVLDRLAPDHDYALVTGVSKLRLPTVTVGDADPPGDVVERLPSAAAVDPERLATLVREVEPYVTLPALVAEAKTAGSADRAGAIATFTGRVRTRDDPDDDPTTRLTFDRYDTVAAERLATIESELTDREGV